MIVRSVISRGKPVARRCCVPNRYFSEAKETVNINWKLKDGSIKTTPATIGMSLLRVAHRNDIDLEGACEASCACSTCHVILEPEQFEKLPEPSEVEEDMLDQAFGLTATSRLGCQVIVEKEHADMLVILPKATRNFYVVSQVS